ncbi:hypothetical protein [Bdellovibrio sp. BCCA]|uniref:hypothetical protein n=1 Tax=Bdellovibrio sp. BCCA TaxID=3136281 RepID=UPI0030F12708
MSLRRPLVTFNKVSCLRAFYGFFAAALVSRVLSDIFELHRWSIHQGDTFPFRLLIEAIPIYPPYILLIEWALILLGALFLLIKKTRLGALLSLFGLLMSLSQMFQNQKVLLLLMAIGLSLGPSLEKTTADERNDTLVFLKWQILLVYLFSAVSKMFDQFPSGETLKMMDQSLFSHQFAVNWIYSAVSVIVILTELFLPVLLWKKPKLGVLAVFVLHAGFGVFLSDIFPFSLAMISLSFLFLIPVGSKKPDQRLVENF